MKWKCFEAIEPEFISFPEESPGGFMDRRGFLKTASTAVGATATAQLLTTMLSAEQTEAANQSPGSHPSDQKSLAGDPVEKKPLSIQFSEYSNWRTAIAAGAYYFRYELDWMGAALRGLCRRHGAIGQGGCGAR
jgi:hypothetical protein